METKSIRVLGGLGLVVGSVLLFAYSVLFPLVLPIDRAATAYASLVASPWWLPLAGMAFVGLLGTMLGFLAVYGRLGERTGALGLAGFLIVEFAHLLQACKVTWEFCLYPALAGHAGSVFLLNDRVLKTDPLVVDFRILAMLSIFAGIVTFCLAIIRSKAFPTLAGYLVLGGALLYGAAAPVNLLAGVVGIAVYALGGLWLGLCLLRPTPPA